MFNFIKKYWFVIIISLFIFLYLTVFFSVMFSPKEDKFDRGFIKCTKETATSIISNKNKSSFKLAGIIIENTYCDIKVMAKGLSDWFKGKQKYPWSNYLFEPVIEEPEKNSDEELLNFYEENPDLEKEMEVLNAKRQELEERMLEQELEEESKIMQPFDIEITDDNEDKEEDNEDKQQ